MSPFYYYLFDIVANRNRIECDIMLKDTVDIGAQSKSIFVQVSHFMHTFEIMEIRHRLPYLTLFITPPTAHCNTFTCAIQMLIFRIYENDHLYTIIKCNGSVELRRVKHVRAQQYACRPNDMM